MIEYGLWTKSDGGFVETQMYSKEEAERRLAHYVEMDAENEDDLSIVQLCPEHGYLDQPKDGCEMCAADEED